MSYTLRFIKNNQEIDQAAEIIGDNYPHCKYKQSASREIKAMFSNSVNPPRYLVAVDKGKIIGIAGFCLAWFDYDFYEIFWVNVAQNRQGQGIGTALVNRVIKEIRKDKRAKFVIITAHKAEFYAKKFKFRKLLKFDSGHQFLMAKEL